MKTLAEAERHMSAFRVPDGLKVQVFATDPQLGSPVAIGLDERNRVYVAEEYRFNRGTEENRTRPFLLEDDLQIQTLDDRLKMFRKYADRFEGGMDWFTKYSDQVRQLVDTNGDGRADRATVFAGGFNGVLDGLAAGVLARNGDVYLTCIPHLWLLRDADDDGVAEFRKPLLTGFGVNAGFLGHDLHGLCWGPDGKLYFSVGDRGFHVQTQEGKTLSGPRTGAVFRCNPDGSQFEVIHRGLRNPQEIAFDDHGNLFAADNNCDKGDHSRLVYIVEGGDSGWNMAYQTIPDPYLTGPWHAEKLWHLAHPGQAAWIVPPVGKLGSGPSGFCYYPGTGLPQKYDRHFFHCNFTGNDGIEAIGVKPQGAGFEITETLDFLKPVMASDAEFGYDGKLYVADFVGLDWNGASKGGRIYTVHDPKLIEHSDVQSTRRLMQDGIERLKLDDLLQCLSHHDQRVRLRSQFTLATRGPEVIKPLLHIVRHHDSQLARLHALWCLGQFPGPQLEIQTELVKLLSDADSEVRAQTAKVFGQRYWHQADSRLIELLSDPEPRVRFFAAQSLGRNRINAALPALVTLLRQNQDADPFLRHAAVQALSLLQDNERVWQLRNDTSSAVRMAVVLVLRKWQDPRVSHFLNDADPFIATEAARVINDLPLDSETEKLANLLAKTDPSSLLEPLLRRVLNANFRLGGRDQAQAVLGVAMHPQVAPILRDEALKMLKDWSTPGPRDRVTGFWRPLEEREIGVVKQVLGESAMPLLTHTTGELQTAAIDLITQLAIPIDNDVIAGWVTDRQRDITQRVGALRLLQARNMTRLQYQTVVRPALKDPEAPLRIVARQIVLDADIEEGIKLWIAAWQSEASTVMEKQQAIRQLARFKPAVTGDVLIKAVEALAAQTLPREYEVDVLEATEPHESPEIKSLLDKYRASLAASDPLARYRPALAGGNARTGQQLFRSHATAQCFRCHKVQGRGGEAGPDLTQLAIRATREHILESLIEPNAKLAPGFGSVAYVLTDGRVIAGTLKAEDPKQVSVLTPDGNSVVIPVTEIEERTAAKSAMPPVGPVLKLGELRDLLEYLTTLR